MSYVRIDIDIDDYIDEIDDDCLISEVISRLNNSKSFKEMFDKKSILEDMTRQEAVDALIDELRLSIIQEQQLREFIKQLWN